MKYKRKAKILLPKNNSFSNNKNLTFKDYFLICLGWIIIYTFVFYI